MAPAFYALHDFTVPFVLTGVTGPATAIFIFLFMIALPLMLLFVEELVSAIFGAHAAHDLHNAFLFLLLAAAFMPMVKLSFCRADWICLSVSILLGWAVIRLSLKYRFVTEYLSVLGALVFVLPVWLLCATDVRHFAFEHHEVVAASVMADDRPPVVVLILDELPIASLLTASGDGINSQIFPNIASLADSSHWFLDAAAASGVTNETVPSMLSGIRPSNGAGTRLPWYSDYPANLFSILAQSYEMHVYEDATRLCPDAVCRAGTEKSNLGSMTHLARMLWYFTARRILPDEDFVLFAEFRNFIMRILNNTFNVGLEVGGACNNGLDMSSPLQNERHLASFMQDIREPSSRPALYYLHLFLPHFPLRYLPGGHRYTPEPPEWFVEGVGDTGAQSADPVEANRVLQQHLLQLAYTDKVLGEIVLTLKQSGLYEPAVIVLAADHGISFEPGLARRHPTGKTLGEILRVPLLIKLPQQKTGVLHREPIEMLGVFPSILAALRIPVPGRIEGSNLLENREMLPSRQALNLDNALERKRAVFPDETVRGLFAMGPRPDLIGRPIASIKEWGLMQGRLNLKRPGEYENVNPSSPYLPALIEGTVTAPAELDEGSYAVVAVNGLVRGCYWLSGVDGTSGSLSILVPEESFQPGKNKVDVIIGGRGSHERH